MWDGVGLVGILLVFAGLHVLWRARYEIEYWLDRYLLLFRKSFDQAASGAAKPVAFASTERKRELLPVLTGLGLVILGFAVTTLFVLERIFF
jgi:hypothetical protein